MLTSGVVEAPNFPPNSTSTDARPHFLCPSSCKEVYFVLFFWLYRFIAPVASQATRRPFVRHTHQLTDPPPPPKKNKNKCDHMVSSNHVDRVGIAVENGSLSALLLGACRRQRRRIASLMNRQCGRRRNEPIKRGEIRLNDTHTGLRPTEQKPFLLFGHRSATELEI